MNLDRIVISISINIKTKCNAIILVLINRINMGPLPGKFIRVPVALTFLSM